jgi:hypothetical protein
MMHNLGLLIVLFNKARLVRKGEELEHHQPAPTEPTDRSDRRRAAGQLTPKMA